MRDRLSRGETVYLLGICPSGHNSTAALVEVSGKNGIVPVCNNEEERYTARRHDDRFPENAFKDIFSHLRRKNVGPAYVLAVVASWDYLSGIPTVLRVGVEEVPFSLHLIRKSASPQMNLWHFLEALQAPGQLKRLFANSKRIPVIGMRHHDNHACFPYAVSPFAGSPGHVEGSPIKRHLSREKSIPAARKYVFLVPASPKAAGCLSGSCEVFLARLREGSLREIV
jgi:predicted NodU family carbamoyl transferase